MKKAKRKALRAAAAQRLQGGAQTAQKTPANPPAPTTLQPLTKAEAKPGREGPTYLWAGTVPGRLLGTDQLVLAGSGRVVALLDDFPALKRLRLLRERQAERQYGIPPAG